MGTPFLDVRNGLNAEGARERETRSGAAAKGIIAGPVSAPQERSARQSYGRDHADKPSCQPRIDGEKRVEECHADVADDERPADK